MLSTKLPASNSCGIHAALASDCTISLMSFMVTFNIGETHSYLKSHNRNVEPIPRAFIIYSYAPTLTKMSRNIVFLLYKKYVTFSHQLRAKLMVRLWYSLKSII